MNQRDLYTSLNHAGCRIISFEDYPTQYGSWRVSLLCNIVSEVNCNPGDSTFSLTSKNTLHGKKTIKIPINKLVSGQLEIGKVIDWVRSLRSDFDVYSNLAARG